ncbi:MAG: hypothetical protein DRJ98_08065 [Thermoprotei archaeon]|nr:MAG: hypothetical protein DRJ98_08065 [Thermoprotei archaeon]
MFSRYASLVKNLRGVVLVDPDEAEERVKWLQDRFKYRNLGVPPSTLKKAEGFFKGKMEGKPFVELVYPTKEVEGLKELCTEEFEVEEDVIEGLILASAYVSPILAIGKNVQEQLMKLALGTVTSKVDLDLKGWKLHLRIADYTVLDLYRWSTEHAENLWRPELNVTEFLEERRKKISRDKSRYWRLARGTNEEWRFLYYIDMASSLAEKVSREAELKKRLMRLNPHEASSGLAIEAAVAIAPRMSTGL